MSAMSSVMLWQMLDSRRQAVWDHCVGEDEVYGAESSWWRLAC